MATAALFAAFAPAAWAGANDGFFGVNAGDLFKLPKAQWDPQLSAMSQDGIQVLRLGAWWSDLEPHAPDASGHFYAWGDTDQQVSALARHGIRWEPLLSFSATWDSIVPGDYTAYPAKPADFAAFAAALTRRYGPDGSFWKEHPELPALPVKAYEVWNEPNAATFWHPQASAPEKYADLYAATRTALHQADPAARVVVGGLAAPAGGVIPADQFVERMLAHRPDLHGSLDAVGFHPYSPTTGGVYSQLASFRHALDSAAGPGVPIEITEIGWSSVDASQSSIASDLSDLATTLPRSDCDVERMMPYAWVGPELDPGDREQWFGIQNRDGSAKPSGAAYGRSVRQMRGLGTEQAPTGSVTICRPAPAPAAAAPVHQGPILQLKVRRERGPKVRIRALARCPTGCGLRFDVRPASADASSAGGAALLARRTLRFSRKLRRVSLHIAPRNARRAGRRVRVDVVAVGRSGQRTLRSRTIRIR